jgi:hypothetical protein
MECLGGFYGMIYGYYIYVYVCIMLVFLVYKDQLLDRLWGFLIYVIKETPTTPKFQSAGSQPANNNSLIK